MLDARAGGATTNGTNGTKGSGGGGQLHLDVCLSPYVLHGVKHIALVPRVSFPGMGARTCDLYIAVKHAPISFVWC